MTQMTRYVARPGSATAHCCFEASVVDTMVNCDFPSVICECNSMLDAEHIADLLNKSLLGMLTIKETQKILGAEDPIHVGKFHDPFSLYMIAAQAHAEPIRAHALPQDIKANEERCTRFGSKPDLLQWKWRDPNTIPDEPTTEEMEAAILDAFISQGPAQVWSGDGSSCAAQIVWAMYVKFSKDAKRYRWLRENTFVEAYYIDGAGGVDTHIRLEGSVDFLDDKIDAEMTKDADRK